jgi:hypothetical protein
VRLEDELAVGSGDFELTVENRMRTNEFTVSLEPLRFERPGKYEIRLFANDRYLGRTLLDMVRLDEQEGW